MSLAKRENGRDLKHSKESESTNGPKKMSKTDKLTSEFERLSREAQDRITLRRIGQSPSPCLEKSSENNNIWAEVAESSHLSLTPAASSYTTKDVELFEGIEGSEEQREDKGEADTMDDYIDSLLRQIEDLNAKIMTADPSQVEALRSQLDLIQKAFEMMKQQAFIASSIEGGNRMKKQQEGDSIKHKSVEPLMQAFERYKGDLSDRSRELLREAIRGIIQKSEALRGLEARLNQLIDMMRETTLYGHTEMVIRIQLIWFIHLSNMVGVMRKKQEENGIIDKEFVGYEPRVTEAVRVCYLACLATVSSISSWLHVVSLSESKTISKLRVKEENYRHILVEKKRHIESLERIFPSLKTQHEKKIWTTKKDLSYESVHNCESEGTCLKEIQNDMEILIENLRQYRIREKDDGASKKELATIDGFIETLTGKVQECKTAIQSCEDYIGLLMAPEGSSIGEDSPFTPESDSGKVIEKGFDSFSNQAEFDAPLGSVIYVSESPWTGPMIVTETTPLTQQSYWSGYSPLTGLAPNPFDNSIPGYFKVSCSSTEEWVCASILNMNVLVNPDFYQNNIVGMPNPITASRYEMRSGLLMSKTDPLRNLPVLLTLKSGVVLTPRPFFQLYLSLKMVVDPTIPSGFGVVAINGKKSQLSYGLLRGIVIPPNSSYRFNGSSVLNRSDGSFSYPNLGGFWDKDQTIQAKSQEMLPVTLNPFNAQEYFQPVSTHKDVQSYSIPREVSEREKTIVRNGHVYLVNDDDVTEKDGGIVSVI